MAADTQTNPDWDMLYEVASSQDGHFTTGQAARAGYSPQLIAHHLRSGRVQRVRRGVYRLTHYPPADHEDLVVLWLWTDRVGVFSHETALFLHGLSDTLPSHADITLPESWRRRRLRRPDGVVLHHGDVPAEQRTWYGAVPVTTVPRTLLDCADAHVAPDLLRQAMSDTQERGLLTTEVVQHLAAAIASGEDRPG